MSPKRKLKQNNNLSSLGLPQCRWKGKTITFRPLKRFQALFGWKGEISLGTTISEAKKNIEPYLTKMESVTGEMPTGDATFGNLAYRFIRDEMGELSPLTARDYKYILEKTIIPVFSMMKPAEIEASHAYQLYDTVAKISGHNYAKKCVAVLSVVLSACVRWGECDRNKIAGNVRIKTPKKRKTNANHREVKPAELDAVMTLESRNGDAVKVVQAYLKLKRATGLRQTDLLRMRVEQIKDGWIEVTPHKTGKKTTWIEVTPELKAVLNECIAVRPALSPYLFCTRLGQSYYNDETGRCEGFKSIWQRFMKRCVTEGLIETPFTEKCIRNYTANQAESMGHAQDLLMHTNQTTTQIYRNITKVKPIRE